MRLFRHPRRLAAGLILATALPAAAGAQSLAAIRTHIAAANPGCDVVRLDEAYRGAVAGAAGHVVVVVYTVEGCGGGNNWASLLGVFSEEAGRIAPYSLPDPPAFVVQSAQVAKGVVEVNGRDYAPNDGRCCPSLRVTARYRIIGRTVSPQP